MERVIERVDFQIPMQPKALRVCAYARVSSGKDAMLHSLSAQVSYYNSLIQSHPGWFYCGVFSDEAITGTKSQRDGFQRMLASCRAGEIDLIITKSISRFARNTVTLLETVRELKSLGVDVFFEEQNIHTMKKVRGVIIAAAVMISFVVGCAGYMISSKLIKSRYTVVIHEPVVVESRAIQE